MSQQPSAPSEFMRRVYWYFELNSKEEERCGYDPRNHHGTKMYRNWDPKNGLKT